MRYFLIYIIIVYFQGSELPGALSAEEQSKLKQTFKRLDTDMDGWVTSSFPGNVIMGDQGEIFFPNHQISSYFQLSEK